MGNAVRRAGYAEITLGKVLRHRCRGQSEEEKERKTVRWVKLEKGTRQQSGPKDLGSKN